MTLMKRVGFLAKNPSRYVHIVRYMHIHTLSHAHMAMMFSIGFPKSLAGVNLD